MAKYGLRSSKPHAVLVAVLASAMMIFGIAQFISSGRFEWFYVLWVAIGVFVVGATLRQAFGAKPGRGAPVDIDDTRDRPRGSSRLWGMTAARDPEGPYRLRPSKPMAVVSAVVAVAMIGFGVAFLHGPFVILWALFAAGIAGFNLWSAFGRKGATSLLERRD